MSKVIIGILILLVIVGLVFFAMRDKTDLAPKNPAPEDSVPAPTPSGSSGTVVESRTGFPLTGGTFCDSPKCMDFKNQLIGNPLVGGN